MAASGYKYLPAQLADKLQAMELSVRSVMGGHYQGKHRSASFGSSVEFAEYREYAPGDPAHRIDWPVYARSDRYVIRQYHEEVSIRCYIILDTSASMDYKYLGNMTKFEYGCYLAAGISYLMAHQGDSVSLLTVDKGKLQQTGPAGSYQGLKPVLDTLETLKPAGVVNMAETMHQVAELCKGKALMVIISDLLEETKTLAGGLGHLFHGGKELAVFHVLDGAELSLPADMTAGGVTLADISCLEGSEKLQIDLADIKDSYARQVHSYLNAVRQAVMNGKGSYILADTRREIFDVLLERSRPL
ncbi:MAG: DUF58 domain-containing protein [Sedimentisphaerales bacterium]|nr:DUF58 domain-containing protein [Sedimentisphaerales bacterium]